MHDIGLIAKTRHEAGRERHGFVFYVGGGLGAVPHQTQVFSDFVPEEELLPLAQAVCRVFARLGEKRNRARARLKFLVAKLGMAEFRRLVEAEREVLPEDDRWTAYLDDLGITDEQPTREGQALGDRPYPDGFEAWRDSNVTGQRQPGYAVATVTLPLGDLTAEQMRAKARICSALQRWQGTHHGVAKYRFALDCAGRFACPICRLGSRLGDRGPRPLPTSLPAPVRIRVSWGFHHRVA